MIGTVQHKTLKDTNAHSIVWQEVADTTARLALIPTAEDNGKVVKQLDDSSYWVLADYSGPTYVEITSTGVAAVTSVFGQTGDVSKADVALDNVDNLLNNLSASTDPGLTDDSDSGYSTGSVWVNTTTPAAFILITSAPGAADWNQIDAAGGGSGTVDVVSNVAASRILGRTSAGSGDSEELTAAQTRTLLNVEDGATADQTGAEIKTAYEGETNTNAYTDAEKTKLTGIETGADKTDTANVTAAGAVMDSEVTNLSGIKTLTVPDATTISVFAKTLLDDTDAAVARTTLDAARTPLSGAGAPGVATGNGYPIGTPYADTTADEAYILTDNTSGSNVWSTPTGPVTGGSSYVTYTMGGRWTGTALNTWYSGTAQMVNSDAGSLATSAGTGADPAMTWNFMGVVVPAAGQIVRVRFYYYINKAGDDGVIHLYKMVPTNNSTSVTKTSIASVDIGAAAPGINLPQLVDSGALTTVVAAHDVLRLWKKNGATVASTSSNISANVLIKLD